MIFTWEFGLEERYIITTTKQLNQLFGSASTNYANGYNK